MITIKDYAASRNKSVQAVYQAMNRSSTAERLEGHVIYDKKYGQATRYLDDEAVLILDEISKRAPIVVLPPESDELKRLADVSCKLAEAAQENAELRLKLGGMESLQLALEDKKREVEDLTERIREKDQSIGAIQKEKEIVSGERDQLAKDKEKLLEEKEKLSAEWQQSEADRKRIEEEKAALQEEKARIAKELEEEKNRSWWKRLLNVR